MWRWDHFIYISSASLEIIKTIFACFEVNMHHVQAMHVLSEALQGLCWLDSCRNKPESYYCLLSILQNDICIPLMDYKVIYLEKKNMFVCCICYSLVFFSARIIAQIIKLMNIGARQLEQKVPTAWFGAIEIKFVLRNGSGGWLC